MLCSVMVWLAEVLGPSPTTGEIATGVICQACIADGNGIGMAGTNGEASGRPIIATSTPSQAACFTLLLRIRRLANSSPVTQASNAALTDTSVKVVIKRTNSSTMVVTSG